MAIQELFLRWLQSCGTARESRTGHQSQAMGRCRWAAAKTGQRTRVKRSHPGGMVFRRMAENLDLKGWLPRREQGVPASLHPREHPAGPGRVQTGRLPLRPRPAGPQTAPSAHVPGPRSALPAGPAGESLRACGASGRSSLCLAVGFPNMGVLGARSAGAGVKSWGCRKRGLHPSLL